MFITEVPSKVTSTVTANCKHLIFNKLNVKELILKAGLIITYDMCCILKSMI